MFVCLLYINEKIYKNEIVQLETKFFSDLYEYPEIIKSSNERDTKGNNEPHYRIKDIRNSMLLAMKMA